MTTAQAHSIAASIRAADALVEARGAADHGLVLYPQRYPHPDLQRLHDSRIDHVRHSRILRAHRGALTPTDADHILEELTDELNWQIEALAHYMENDAGLVSAILDLIATMHGHDDTEPHLGMRSWLIEAHLIAHPPPPPEQERSEQLTLW